MLAKLIRLPLRLIPRDTIVTAPQGLTKGMKWRVGSSTHGCWLGTYEAAEQAAVRELVKPNMIAYDIGANAGYYTLGLSRLCRHVYAFEPFPENVNNLLLHIRENRLANVTVIQAAIADADGMAGFSCPGHNAMGKLGGAELQVATRTLDSLIVSGLPVPDFVKVDIEGAEAQMLVGAAKLLALHRTTWLVSLHMPGIPEIFERAGYHVRNASPTDIIAEPRGH